MTIYDCTFRLMQFALMIMEGRKISMKYDEALKQCIEWFNSGGIGELDAVAFNIAINSLEKQIPKKIDIIFCPSVGKLANICPSCGYDSFGDNEDKYCCNCGQRIDFGWNQDDA